MTAKELIAFEVSGGEDGITTDLSSELSDKLLEAVTLLEACVMQCEEYSDNELVINWETNESYKIADIKKFIGGSDESTPS